MPISPKGIILFLTRPTKERQEQEGKSVLFALCLWFRENTEEGVSYFALCAIFVVFVFVYGGGGPISIEKKGVHQALAARSDIYSHPQHARERSKWLLYVPWVKQMPDSCAIFIPSTISLGVGSLCHSFETRLLCTAASFWSLSTRDFLCPGE